MATTYKVRYKNHCTPQEQIDDGGKYYLDSDCGRKLTGVADTSSTINYDPTFVASKAVTATGSECELSAAGDNYQFVYIKNTGSTDVLVTLDDSNYFILLSEGEAFASEISANTIVRVKTTPSGTSTVEYYVAK